MADIDIDPFGEHNRTEEPTDKNIPLMSQSIPTGYIPPGNSQGLAQKDCPGGRDLTFESCQGAEN